MPERTERKKGKIEYYQEAQNNLYYTVIGGIIVAFFITILYSYIIVNFPDEIYYLFGIIPFNLEFFLGWVLYIIFPIIFVILYVQLSKRRAIRKK